MPTITKQPTQHAKRQEVKLSSSPQAPAAARRYVCAQLRNDTAHPEPLVDALALITSELSTNAFRYGTEPGDSLLVVLLTMPDLVRVEVHDTVRRHPHFKPESDARARGRGLFIVDHLAMRWGVDDRPFGKIVWAEVAR